MATTITTDCVDCMQPRCAACRRKFRHLLVTQAVSHTEHWLHLARRFSAEAAVIRAERPALADELTARAHANLCKATRSLNSYTEQHDALFDDETP